MNVRGMMAAIALVAAGAAAAGAGQRPATTAPAQTSEKPTDLIKATGCVVSAQNAFRLTNASIEVEPYFGPGGAPAKGAPKPQASTTTFVLENGTNLAAHVGHKVTVTGKVGPASANTADSEEVPVPERGRGGRGGGGTQRVYVPRLNVQSLAMVSTTCP